MSQPIEDTERALSKAAGLDPSQDQKSAQAIAIPLFEKRLTAIRDRITHVDADLNRVREQLKEKRDRYNTLSSSLT